MATGSGHAPAASRTDTCLARHTTAPEPPRRAGRGTGPMPAVRIAFEHLLDQECQTIKALAHVGVPGRQPNPRAARNWDHRRRLLFASAFISAATVRASTAPVIRIRPPLASSTSITPAFSPGGGDAAPGSGMTAIELNAAGTCTRLQSCWHQRNNWLV